jgi:hypothetical protein
MTFLNRVIQSTIVIILAALLSGCVFTKFVTVPMRVGGAVISVVPVAGNVADAGIDAAADVIDTVPF